MSSPTVFQTLQSHRSFTVLSPFLTPLYVRNALFVIFRYCFRYRSVMRLGKTTIHFHHFFMFLVIFAPRMLHEIGRAHV